MKIIRSAGEMRDFSERSRGSSRSIGLVPTMGYLHEGHMSLVKASLAECDLTVVSIFVNPAQFGPGEDLGKYPRDLDRDTSLLEKAGVDALFVPEDMEMYPQGYSTYVDVDSPCARKLCGASRPGHFRGVATIVAKLFNIVIPDRSYFGQKDAQQVFIIKKMVSDLNFKTIVRVLPTVRESDGLAMSSRNKYLSPDDRRRAPLVFKALEKAKEVAESGERNSEKILKIAREVLSSSGGIKLDYIDLVDTNDLETLKELKSEALVILAAFIGSTRLIDNMVITPEKGKK